MDAALLTRSLVSAIREDLADTPVVCLLGPRQSGKTTLVRSLVPEYGYLTFDDEETLSVAQRDPTGFVATLPERVILDEIQRVPELTRAIKLAVDRDRRPGRFVLTGSANLLALPKLGDSVAGRMSIQNLQPLSESEKESRPGGFLTAWLAGNIQPALLAANRGPDPTAAAARVVAGGFPNAVRRTPASACAWHRDYLRTLLERDVQVVAQVRDLDAMAKLVELVALRTGELLNVSTFSNELNLRRETVEQYLGICERLFLIRRLQPWHRSEAKRLIKSPKLHFVDSGLAATLSDLSAEDWTANGSRFGHLLESWVLQQLIAQAGWTDPALKFWHYRDKDQVEVDVVMTRGRRTWGVEIKMSATPSLADISGLRRLAAQCGDDFAGGILFHAGPHITRLEDPRFLAVPLAKLWEM